MHDNFKWNMLLTMLTCYIKWAINDVNCLTCHVCSKIGAVSYQFIFEITGFGPFRILPNTVCKRIAGRIFVTKLLTLIDRIL